MNEKQVQWTRDAIRMLQEATGAGVRMIIRRDMDFTDGRADVEDTDRGGVLLTNAPDAQIIAELGKAYCGGYGLEDNDESD